MKILAISDLHIVSTGDDAHKFFQKFITFSKNDDSNVIILLGDIFDIMVGSQYGYLRDFEWYFNSIKELLDQGKKVYFIEGNHDFHLAEVFHKYLKDIKNFSNFTYAKSSQTIQVGGKTIVFMHGDDLDLDNKNYKRWKNTYSSKPFKFFVNYLIPYPAVKWLGLKASRGSKALSRATFDFENFKKKYRSKVENFFNTNSHVDVLVAGHTHIKDHFYFGNKIYVNAGFPGKDNSYIQITEDTIEVLEI